jgi:hypothetical protein
MTGGFGAKTSVKLTRHRSCESGRVLEKALPQLVATYARRPDLKTVFLERSSTKERSCQPPKFGNKCKDLRARASISEHEMGVWFLYFLQFYNKLRSATEQMPALVIIKLQKIIIIFYFNSAESTQCRSDVKINPKYPRFAPQRSPGNLLRKLNILLCKLPTRTLAGFDMSFRKIY